MNPPQEFPDDYFRIFAAGCDTGIENAGDRFASLSDFCFADAEDFQFHQNAPCFASERERVHLPDCARSDDPRIEPCLFCLIFRHKVVKMKLFSPEKDGTLGYVNHVYNPKSRFQRIGNFFIGTGPVWGGVFMLWLVTRLLLPSDILSLERGLLEAVFNLARYIISVEFWSRWQSYCWLYLILTISSHVTLSPPDLVGATAGASTLIVTVFLFGLALGWHSSLSSFVDRILHNMLVYTSSILGLFGFITLLIAIILMIFVRKR